MGLAPEGTPERVVQDILGERWTKLMEAAYAYQRDMLLWGRAYTSNPDLARALGQLPTAQGVDG